MNQSVCQLAASQVATTWQWQTIFVITIAHCAALPWPGYCAPSSGPLVEKSAVSEPNGVPWGPESNGIRCRLVAVTPNIDDESPAAASSVDTFARSDDVTFVVELRNVSNKPLTLLGVRFGESYGNAAGKLNAESFAPHFFEFEFSDRNRSPVPRPKRVFVYSFDGVRGASTHEIGRGKSLRVVLRPAKFSSPMNYELGPGSYRAKVRYYLLPSNDLARLQQMQPNNPRARAWIGNAVSNEVAFAVAAGPNGHVLSDLNWGEPTKGLRAAVEFSPSKRGHATVPPDTVPLNSRLNTNIHLQNVSDRPIDLISETWRQDDRVFATDEAGNETQIGGPWYTGWPVMARWSLKPTEVATIRCSDVNVVQDEDSAKSVKHPIGRVLRAKPGVYQIRFNIRMNDIRSNHWDGTTLPASTDWQGELVTGQTPIKVRARTPEDDAADSNASSSD